MHNNGPYFQPDPGYDKKVYENSLLNIIWILLAFAAFYTLNIIWFWGSISLAMSHAWISNMFNVAYFSFTCVVFVLLLVYGNHSNKLRAKRDYYKRRITELNQQKQEEEEKRSQKEKNKARQIE
mmetsp:Transcript_6929/g.6099  ORF Transcript_6929/g.6099 Transcript_6929/m.6099 type:complete len:124 (+) Transcript_6929:13-384(+)